MSARDDVVSTLSLQPRLRSAEGFYSAALVSPVFVAMDGKGRTAS